MDVVIGIRKGFSQKMTLTNRQKYSQKRSLIDIRPGKSSLPAPLKSAVA
ncbi:hypothetical protein UF75_3299 [Desulfosporosinus sp. I2]|nr:hypothetical protein [Desulfosporosinus sp. I2]KJR46326.1 hypothetical protein UF75_3299 [Desulfosporosinus sp. I2]